MDNAAAHAVVDVFDEAEHLLDRLGPIEILVDRQVIDIAAIVVSRIGGQIIELPVGLHDVVAFHEGFHG